MFLKMENSFYSQRNMTPNRAVVKGEYLMIIQDNFSSFSMEPYVGAPSSEPSRDGSDEGSQHVFLCRIDKDYP